MNLSIMRRHYLIKCKKNATIKELDAINRNNTLEFTKLPSNKKTIYVKWVFHLKLKPNGEITKHKERFVAR